MTTVLNGEFYKCVQIKFFDNDDTNRDNLRELEQMLLDCYDEFLYQRDGYHMDEDTTYETLLSGMMYEDGTFSPDTMTINIDFIDEMNEVVSQTVFVDFHSGDITISDDDYGIMHRETNDSFLLYD